MTSGEGPHEPIHTTHDSRLRSGFPAGYRPVFFKLGLDAEDRRERWPVTRHQIYEERVRLVLLVVDDVEINQMVARAILERMGHAVTCAASGREALDIMADCTFDAVFMDVQMPVMDGLETAAAIRAREMSSGERRRVI